MPPDRGRAGKACATCRKQKTRCYAGEHGAACLRCNTLRQICSFTTEGLEESPSYAAASETDARLERLEGAVNLLLSRLGEGVSGGVEDQSPTPAGTRDASLNGDAISSVYSLRDVAIDPAVAPYDLNRNFGDEDVIQAGLISLSDAIQLMQIFQEHYGKWVALEPTIAPEVLLHSIRKSPLLVCVCCLVAVRHYSIEIAQTLAPVLLGKAKSLLSTALLVNSQPIEFFQAAIALCMWSTSIAQQAADVDGWLVSGFALQHSFSTKLFDFIQSSSPVRQSRKHFDRHRIFNHLVLVHLHYCCSAGRKVGVGRFQIEKCRDILASDYSTNLEQRVAAEIELYWHICEKCIGESLDLPSIQEHFHEWKQSWSLVIDQPRSQILLMEYHFAQLLMHERSLKLRLVRVQKSLLNEMVILCVAILTIAMNITDDRTAYLKDHIYHVEAFAAVTLCRLLRLYDRQLASTHNITELDSLLLRFIGWLKDIGLPCHPSYALSLTIARVYEKLRTDDQPPSPRVLSPSTTDTRLGGNYVPSVLPDLLDIDVLRAGNWALIPDWEPLDSMV